MRRLALLGLLCALLVQEARAESLDRGLAITDPVLLQRLDRGETSLDLSIGRVLAARPEIKNNAELLALPQLASVRAAIESGIDRYAARQRAASSVVDADLGDNDIRLFDRVELSSPKTRFMLSGIVNRFDRAYTTPGGCGEIRLIYRLVHDDADGKARLPMTMSVVLRAGGSNSASPPCGKHARRWLTGDPDAALQTIDPATLDRIEINVQVAYAPRRAERPFRTDYLMMVFRRDPAGVFETAPMENQIDHGRLVADPSLRTEFVRWLGEHLAEFDRGTLMVPSRFLASEAIATTPSLTVVEPPFDSGEVTALLERADQPGLGLRNIRSPAGFARRLSDMTCNGCHQTRGVGGFHFPGVDPVAAPGSIHGSPFYFGDQPRRHDIARALADGRRPDFSRGFSDRPQRRAGLDLRGTSYDDGWGATCYRSHDDSAQDDRSFRDWTCAPGLVCQPLQNAAANDRIGMCFVGAR